jgi:toxin CcdB
VARFDLHRAPGVEGYLLNIQDALHDHLSTRVVVPVLPAATAPPPSRGLNPRVEIVGEIHIVFPQYLSAVPRRELGKPIGNLDAHRDDITRALDLLLTGF